jgi:heme-degrading monooxygenase HmoA
VVRPTRLTEAYESVFEVDAPNANAANSTAERWIEGTAASVTAAPALEQHFREVGELGIKHVPGVLSVRLRRSMGDDTKYLLLVITTDRAAARAWPLAPEIRARIEANSGRQLLTELPKAEIHYVVKRYAGPALSGVQPAAAATAR